MNWSRNTKGTKPEHNATEDEVETQSFVVFHHSANQVRLRCKIVSNYHEYTTSTGIMS
jgi:hypothetical protein